MTVLSVVSPAILEAVPATKLTAPSPNGSSVFSKAGPAAVIVWEQFKLAFPQVLATSRLRSAAVECSALAILDASVFVKSVRVNLDSDLFSLEVGKCKIEQSVLTFSKVLAKRLLFVEIELLVLGILVDMVLLCKPDNEPSVVLEVE